MLEKGFKLLTFFAFVCGFLSAELLIWESESELDSESESDFLAIRTVRYGRNQCNKPSRGVTHTVDVLHTASRPQVLVKNLLVGLWVKLLVELLGNVGLGRGK